MSKFIQIPYQRLPPDVLQAVIEEFITREGTEYGGRIFSLEEKMNQIRRQLETGKAFITFDEETETCNIIQKEFLSRRDI